MTPELPEHLAEAASANGGQTMLQECSLALQRSALTLRRMTQLLDESAERASNVVTASSERLK